MKKKAIYRIVLACNGKYFSQYRSCHKTLWFYTYGNWISVDKHGEQWLSETFLYHKPYGFDTYAEAEANLSKRYLLWHDPIKVVNSWTGNQINRSMK